MELTGKITKVLEPQSGTGTKGEWKKQQVIISTGGEHSKDICLTLWNEKEFNNEVIGATMNASIDISSREYNGRYYTDVKCWKFEIVGRKPKTEPLDEDTEETDDLPF